MSESIHKDIAESLPALSHLECEICHKVEELGNVEGYLRNGWPKHCSMTMRLYTQREVDDAKKST